MSLLNLSRITLKSLRRLPVMRKFIPIFSRTLFASTRPLMNMNTRQEWPKIVDELIKEAARLEQKNQRLLYLRYFGITFVLLFISVAALYRYYERQILNIILQLTLARTEEINKLKEADSNSNQLVGKSEFISYQLFLRRMKVIKEVDYPNILSRSEDMHKLILRELNANQMVKDCFGTFNLGKQAKVRFALFENFSKTDPKLEMTNNMYKNATPIKMSQNEHARVNKFAVTFRLVGSKNSGYAVAILEKDVKLKMVRIERILLDLDSPGYQNIKEFSIKTNLYFVKYQSLR